MLASAYDIKNIQTNRAQKMSKLIADLQKRGLIHPPAWLADNTHYLTIMGSHAYGVADTSVKEKIPDYDVYGFAIPPKAMIFPHLNGHIPGFGPEPQLFDQYQQHHIVDSDANGGLGKEWDFSVFSIVKFFELCRGNNPNMIDSLFTPENCIIHCTQIGRLVRDNRRLFLSKLCWKNFRGYAASQLHKMNSKEPIGGRKEIIKRHGYDVKFAYHVIRLFDEAEQIMMEGEINLQRAKDVMKAIRRGDWTAGEVAEWAKEKDKALEVVYTQCKLPETPPIEPIRLLLLNCLEQHYGSLEHCVAQMGWAEQTLKDIDQILNCVRSKLYS